MRSEEVWVGSSPNLHFGPAPWLADFVGEVLHAYWRTNYQRLCSAADAGVMRVAWIAFPRLGASGFCVGAAVWPGQRVDKPCLAPRWHVEGLIALMPLNYSPFLMGLKQA